jgi:hypothetical protein
MVAKFLARECFSVYSEDFAGSDRNRAGKTKEISPGRIRSAERDRRGNSLSGCRVTFTALTGIRTYFDKAASISTLPTISEAPRDNPVPFASNRRLHG